MDKLELMKNIVVLAFEGAQVLDITGPMEVFSYANQFASRPQYKIECVAAKPPPVQMSNGLSLNPLVFSKYKQKIDTIIVPGGSEDALTALSVEQRFRAWLTKQLGASRRVVSVCTGAFVLAELGILDGKRATTHWSACTRLKQFSPSTQVDSDAIYTKDGSVYTSAGVTTGIDLALSLVEEDLGKEVSLEIARSLVLYLRRSGGQSQYSLPLSAQTLGISRIEKIVDYIQHHLRSDLTINGLSDKFSISTRQLSRLFISELGLSPGAYVTKVRLDAARTYLEETQSPLKKIASLCGYSSQDAMSRAFRLQFGVTPGQYRGSFS